MIKVSFDVYSSAYQISKALQRLADLPLLSFDTETAGVYSKEERAEAKKVLKKGTDDKALRKSASLVANNNGLSYPALVNVTHFVFGTSDSHSVILVCDDHRKEMLVWKWLCTYKGKIIVHNSLFDLKIMHHRVGQLPVDYEDSALLAKTVLNNADNWKAKIGLKELMSSHYDPAWTLIDSYEPEDLHDPKFLRYTAIDGCATMLLYQQLREYLNE